MYVLIAGSGKLGAGLAKTLVAERYDVAIIDFPVETSELGSGFDGLVVEGSPMDRDTLELAGIRKADLFVAATSDDNLNAALLLLVDAFYKVPSKVARFVDPERERFYSGLGYETICPTSTGINQILDKLRTSQFSALNATIDPSMVCVLPREEWLGKPVDGIGMPKGRKCVGIVRSGCMKALDRSLRVTEGDTLVLARKGSGGI